MSESFANLSLLCAACSARFGAEEPRVVELRSAVAALGAGPQTTTERVAVVTRLFAAITGIMTMIESDADADADVGVEEIRALLEKSLI